MDSSAMEQIILNTMAQRGQQTSPLGALLLKMAGEEHKGSVDTQGKLATEDPINAALRSILQGQGSDAALKAKRDQTDVGLNAVYRRAAENDPGALNVLGKIHHPPAVSPDDALLKELIRVVGPEKAALMRYGGDKAATDRRQKESVEVLKMLHAGVNASREKLAKWLHDNPPPARTAFPDEGAFGQAMTTWVQGKKKAERDFFGSLGSDLNTYHQMYGQSSPELGAIAQSLGAGIPGYVQRRSQPVPAGPGMGVGIPTQADAPIAPPTSPPMAPGGGNSLQTITGAIQPPTYYGPGAVDPIYPEDPLESFTNLGEYIGRKLYPGGPQPAERRRNPGRPVW